jgi:hypothetical protein
MFHQFMRAKICVTENRWATPTDIPRYLPGAIMGGPYDAGLRPFRHDIIFPFPPDHVTP